MKRAALIGSGRGKLSMDKMTEATHSPTEQSSSLENCLEIDMNVNLRRRISRLERILKNHAAHTAAAGPSKQVEEHDRVTGDDLLRAWECSDDWLREQIKGDFESRRLSPDAKSHLQ